MNCLDLQIIEANTFYSRFRGLIARALPAGHGLLFRKANSLHTFFMNQNIDILFLDEHFTVIELYQKLQPWRLCRSRRATHFIEVPSTLQLQVTLGYSFQKLNP